MRVGLELRGAGASVGISRLIPSAGQFDPSTAANAYIHQEAQTERHVRLEDWRVPLSAVVQPHAVFEAFPARRHESLAGDCDSEQLLRTPVVMHQLRPFGHLDVGHHSSARLQPIERHSADGGTLRRGASGRRPCEEVGQETMDVRQHRVPLARDAMQIHDVRRFASAICESWRRHCDMLVQRHQEKRQRLRKFWRWWVRPFPRASAAPGLSTIGALASAVACTAANGPADVPAVAAHRGTIAYTCLAWSLGRGLPERHGEGLSRRLSGRA
mmetsp:Transcript_70127/g.195052  ORF Transcript_70127/g.195052 Transcript_70127/m.195052 type:complete len:271 (+) Transcript_70127:2576-3388(+)